MKIKESCESDSVFKNVSEYNRYDWRVEYDKRKLKKEARIPE